MTVVSLKWFSIAPEITLSRILPETEVKLAGLLIIRVFLLTHLEHWDKPHNEGVITGISELSWTAQKELKNYKYVSRTGQG